MATCLFTEAYKRQYSYIMLSHGREHYETAQFTTGLKRVPYQELSTANKTSLWKARQFADQYCCSYDYFISTVLSAAARRLWVLERLRGITRDKRVRIIFSAVWLMEIVPERVIYAHFPEELEEARRFC